MFITVSPSGWSPASSRTHSLCPPHVATHDISRRRYQVTLSTCGPSISQPSAHDTGRRTLDSVVISACPPAHPRLQRPQSPGSSVFGKTFKLSAAFYMFTAGEAGAFYSPPIAEVITPALIPALGQARVTQYSILSTQRVQRRERQILKSARFRFRIGNVNLRRRELYFPLPRGLVKYSIIQVPAFPKASGS